MLFDAAIGHLKELDGGNAGRYCGQRLAAEAGATDDALVADLSHQLGAGWRAAEEIPASQGVVRTYRWQNECSARFYGLIAYQQLQRAAGGTEYRPPAACTLGVRAYVPRLGNALVGSVFDGGRCTEGKCRVAL